MTAASLPRSFIEEAEQGGIVQGNASLTRRFGGGKTTESQAVSASGETTLVTPVSGKAVVLYWVAVASEETGTVEARVLLGGTPYRWFPGKAGPFSHWEPIQGAVNEPLKVKLSGSEKLVFSYTYSEG